MGRSLLSEIEDSIDFGSITVDAFYEIINAMDSKNAGGLNMVKTNSSKYSILNNGGTKLKKSNFYIFTLPWNCQNVLKYFELDSIYKGAEIVIREFSIKRSEYSPYNCVESYILFRGHNKRQDNAISIDKFSNYRSLDKNMHEAIGRLCNIFASERKFNSMINRVRKYHKMDIKLFNYIKNETV